MFRNILKTNILKTNSSKKINFTTYLKKNYLTPDESELI